MRMVWLSGVAVAVVGLDAKTRAEMRGDVKGERWASCGLAGNVNQKSAWPTNCYARDASIQRIRICL